MPAAENLWNVFQNIFFETFILGHFSSGLPAADLAGAESFGTDGVGIFLPGFAVHTCAATTRSCKFCTEGEGFVLTCCFIVLTEARALRSLIFDLV